MTMFESDSAYDAFMGRYSRRLAPVFADFAELADGSSVAEIGARTLAQARPTILGCAATVAGYARTGACKRQDEEAA